MISENCCLFMVLKIKGIQTIITMITRTKLRNIAGIIEENQQINAIEIEI